jgi:hypothetical protein
MPIIRLVLFIFILCFLLKYFFQELGQVFEIPDVEDFPLSSTFGPVDGLPSQKRPFPKSYENLVYKASWQVWTEVCKQHIYGVLVFLRLLCELDIKKHYKITDILLAI